MSSLLDEEKSWQQRDFGLDRRLIKGLSKMGFTFPTMIQSKSIPIALEGKDILVRARTGSGKTVAFGLPLLHKLLNGEKGVVNIRALILAPTKELCKQIEKNVKDLMYYCKDVLSICSLTDDNVNAQLFRLQSKPDIVVSTPARLVQHLKNGTIDISLAKTVVIDEADLILSFGYAEDVQIITSKLPQMFQGLLMSATLSPELDKFKRIVLKNPAVIKLEEGGNADAGNLAQFYLSIPEHDKYLVFYVFMKLGLLQGKGLVFVNDVNKCYRLKLFLQQFFIQAAVLNAELPLNSRIHILEEFNRGVFDLLIATDSSLDQGDANENDDDEEEAEEGSVEGDEEEDDDSNIVDEDDLDDSQDEEVDEDEEEESGDSDASEEVAAAEAIFNRKEKSKKTEKYSDSDFGVARGIDFQNVSFVINFDFPITSAAYTHRIGRTARGGASGTALSLVTTYDASTKGKELSDAKRDHAVLYAVRRQQVRLGGGDGNTSALGALSANQEVALSVGSHGHDSVMAEDESKMQPSPLVFNMQELETFRYRVQDTLRSVTGSSVQELRAAELKKEILNSSKLKSFFAQNPNDLKVLRHDKAIVHPLRQHNHLKHIPEYLVPSSMRSVIKIKTNNKRKRNASSSDKRIKSSQQKDPLRNPSGAASSSANSGSEQAAQEERYDDNQDDDDGGDRLAGRNNWKMRHNKGKFNPQRLKDKNENISNMERGKRQNRRR